MAKIRVSLLFLFGVSPLFSQSDFLWSEAQHPRKLLLDLYSALYNSGGRMPAYLHYSFKSIEDAQMSEINRFTDTLIYLNRQYKKHNTAEMVALNADTLTHMIASGKVPAYNQDEVVDHLRRLYAWRNPDNGIFAVEQPSPLIFATFLTVADKVDGTFDSALDLPNLPQFYSLLVEKKVPLPAICYDCRDKNAWVDRRSLFKSTRLHKELPKSLKKLAGKRYDDTRRLNAINQYINKRIQSSEDGWQTDYWQTPDETLLVEEGDCEDFAILFTAIAEYLGVEAHVVIGDIIIRNEEGRIESLGHAWVEAQDRLIDPIMTDYTGAINYKGHFRFNSTSASLILPEAKPNFNNRLAVK